MRQTSPNLDSAWKQWYRLNHKDAYMNKSGESFEAYISDVMEKLYPDFIDPDPMGRLGDGGCDGLANKGQLFIACYGQRARANQDAKAKAKIQSDFEHAVQGTTGFTEWCFITMDDRQLASCLKIGVRLAEEYDFQYIVTINTDRLEAAEKIGFDRSDYPIPVSLTDSGETGGLFGFRFN